MNKDEILAIVRQAFQEQKEVEANEKARLELETKTKEVETLNARIAELEEKAKIGSETKNKLNNLQAEITKATNTNVKVDKEKLAQAVANFRY